MSTLSKTQRESMEQIFKTRNPHVAEFIGWIEEINSKSVDEMIYFQGPTEIIQERKGYIRGIREILNAIKSVQN